MQLQRLTPRDKNFKPPTSIREATNTHYVSILFPSIQRKHSIALHSRLSTTVLSCVPCILQTNHGNCTPSQECLNCSNVFTRPSLAQDACPIPGHSALTPDAWNESQLESSPGASFGKTEPLGSRSYPTTRPRLGRGRNGSLYWRRSSYRNAIMV